MDSFSCSPLNIDLLDLYWKNLKKRKSWIRRDVTWWCHFNITMTSRGLMWGQRAAVCFLSFPRAGTGISHMGKNSGNPDLVCEKDWSEAGAFFLTHLEQIFSWCSTFIMHHFSLSVVSKKFWNELLKIKQWIEQSKCDNIMDSRSENFYFFVKMDLVDYWF